MRFRISKAWSMDRAKSEATHGLVCSCGDCNLLPLINAERKKARKTSPLRADPTRTGRVRREFISDVNRRFKSLLRDITDLIIVDDAFGLKTKAPLKLNLNAERWQFVTSDEKVKQFRGWLDRRIDAGLLSVDTTGTAWTAKYIDSAYKQGVRRGYDDATRAGYEDTETLPGFSQGQRSAFLSSSFAAPERASKLRLLQTRTFEDLRGVTAQMSSRMARALADGLAEGRGILDIADSVRSAAGIPLTRARTIARSEIIYAHSEGQLDSFEDLGVDEIGVMAEWSTAGDDRVCELCASLEGVVMTVKEARGLIPRHPNCRCTWLPANVGETGKGQKRTKTDIAAAIRRSLRTESPSSKSAKEARERSRWSGADREFSGKRPQPALLFDPSED